MLNFGKVLTSETQRFSAELDVFIKNTTQGLTKLRSAEEQYQTKELENLAGLSGRINDQIQRVQDVMSLIQAKDELSAEALDSAQTAVKEAHNSIRTVFSSWSDKLEKSGLSLRADLERSSANGFQAVRMISTVFRNTFDDINPDRKSPEFDSGPYSECNPRQSRVHNGRAQAQHRSQITGREPGRGTDSLPQRAKRAADPPIAI